MSKKQNKKVRIEFRDDEGRAENLEATAVGRNAYRLENSPSFAYSVSAQDVVKVRRGRDGTLRFAGVVEKSGNRTLRVMMARFSATSESARPILENVERMGCACESLQPFVLCITAPPGTDFLEVVDYLKSLSMWWEYADPTPEAT